MLKKGINKKNKIRRKQIIAKEFDLTYQTCDPDHGLN
jgi:hypothetical protein